MSIGQKIEMSNFLDSVRQFFSWWIEELDSFFRQLNFDGPHWNTLLYKSAGGMDIYVRSHGEIKHITTIYDDDDAQQMSKQLFAIQGRSIFTRNTVLRLSNNILLERTLALPSAISDVIEPVIEHKLEQIVPWPSDQSWFGYSLSDDQRSDGVIMAKIVAVRKQNVEMALAQASSLGFDQVRIDISDDVEKPEGITLVNFDSASTDGLASNTFKVLGSLFMILLIIGLVGFGRLANVHTSMERSEEKLAALNEKKSQIGEARSENLALIRQRNWLINLRKEKRSVSVIIESLTRILPDSTQLTRLEMSDKSIVISGRTDNAAELIDKLENSSDFIDVRFYSPTLRKNNDAKETFSIECEIESAPIGREKI